MGRGGGQECDGGAAPAARLRVPACERDAAAVQKARARSTPTRMTRHLCAAACQVAAGYRLPIGDEVPAPLAKLLSQCLAGRPEDRPSMAEVAARLQDCARSGELEAAEHMHGPRASAAVCCALM